MGEQENALAKKAVEIHLVGAHFDSMKKVASQKLDRDETFGRLYVASKIDLLIQVDLSAGRADIPVVDEKQEEVHVDILAVVGLHKDPAHCNSLDRASHNRTNPTDYAHSIFNRLCSI